MTSWRKPFTSLFIGIMVINMGLIAMDAPSFTEGIGAQNDLSSDDWVAMQGLLGTAVAPVYNVELNPDMQELAADAGDTVIYSVEVRNLGNSTETYNLGLDSFVWPTEIRDETATIIISGVLLAPGETYNFTVVVNIPGGALGGEFDEAIVNASSQTEPNVYDLANIGTSVFITPPFLDPFDGTWPTYRTDYDNLGPGAQWEMGDPSGFGPTAPTVILSEDFEGAFPPAGWTVVNYLGGPPRIWYNNTYYGRPNYIGGSALCADAWATPGPIDTGLWTPSFSLVGYTDVGLEFDMCYNDRQTGSAPVYIAEVRVSIDGGGSWLPIATYDDNVNPTGPGVHIALDLFAFAGEPNVMVDFRYYNHNGGGYWWQVDNVIINATFRSSDLILSEDFEAAWPPAGWTIINYMGGPGWLNNIMTGRSNYIGTGICADALNMPGGFISGLRTPSFSLVGYTDVGLEFDMCYEDRIPGSFPQFIAQVRVSIDGGGFWSPIATYDDDVNPTGPGVHIALDLTAFVGEPNVMVEFLHDINAAGPYWWQVDNVVINAFLPVSCWGTNLLSDYAWGADCFLYTPYFDLTLATSADMNFQHWYNIEADRQDGGWVEVSTDYGENWAQLTPLGGYPNETAPNVPGYTGFAPCYAGVSSEWLMAEFDLSAYLGQVMILRFRFWSEPFPEPGYPGWYIDDLNVSANFTLITPFNVPLLSGWNLISFPVGPSNTSLVSVLDSISGSWDNVQYYDASDPADPWKSYSTFKPQSLNDLWILKHDMAFWIHTTTTCTLTVDGLLPVVTLHILYSGWNLVGYPSFTEKSISEALAGAGYDMPVEGFNATAPYRISQLADTYMMKPGEGYWVHVPMDTVWVVDW